MDSKLSRWALVPLLTALIWFAASAADLETPPAFNSPDTLLRYTNLPPDGREAVLVEESRQQAADKAAARQPFSQEELIQILNDVALRYGLDPELLWAVAWTESRFEPYVTSNMGAQGLMQLMPSTARDIGVRNLMNPWENAEGGARLLRWLLNEYDNNLTLALAAYNAGTGAVRKGGQVPPILQTRSFVYSVLTMREHFRRQEP